ncbi:MAG: serine/threonine protein kinase [Planctomycetaceae bacterium]|nr:serine/threonine protein kinase [Planctomycetaceae bacterium]
MHPLQVGPYAIDKKIGAGGMGTVFLGRHRDTGQLAAVKVLPPSLAREDGFVARFTREIDAMKRLANPHVVELFDSGVDHETYYYAMEYVEGETLTSKLMREKRMPWRESVDVALQICVALKAAHDAGIIHRDLKPSNLLIATDGTVKLTDFGVAQVFAGGKLTVTGGIIGTAEYMSPEQAAGARATKKSDLYSLGAVLYAMLTGRPPFTGKTTLEVMQKHRHAQFDRASRYVADLPHWLDDLVSQLLDKDPDKRPPDAYVLSKRLQEILRKVELSSGAAETVAGVPTGSGTSAESGGHDGPGVATLMRDLVQHEVREAQKLSPIASFFDNIWVLLVLFVLLIGGGIAWFKYRTLPPDQQYAAGVALMDQPEGPDWLRARDQYFQPLVQSDPDTWQEKIQPHLDRIALYDWKSSVTRKRPRKNDSAVRSEPQRLLQIAQHAYEAGDWPRAERMLAALVTLLKDDPDHQPLHAAAVELLDGVRKQRTLAVDEYLVPALSRVKTLSSEGKKDEARKLLDSLRVLYGDDPAAPELLRSARDELETEPALSP